MSLKIKVPEVTKSGDSVIGIRPNWVSPFHGQKLISIAIADIVDQDQNAHSCILIFDLQHPPFYFKLYQR